MQSNRDVILEAINNMDDEHLGDFLTNLSVSPNLDDICCEDCQAEHNGKCPGSGDCIMLPLTTWLGWLCRNPARLRRALTDMTE